jgi:hypothetical protein
MVQVGAVENWGRVGMTELLTIDEDADEYFFSRNWTDGLPVVAPTVDKVNKMLEAVQLDSSVVLGEVAERSRQLTAEKAAINAVMAGCKPEYFPIVVAALSAILDPAFNAHTVLTSTGGAATCVLVSGPMASEIGMRSKHNVLGAGNRANLTIGRAVRLVAANIFGARTGDMDGSSIGHPGKISMCFAEDDPEEFWLPLRTELGYSIDDTTVTVFGSEGPRQVANHLNPDPVGILNTFAAAMRCPSTFSVGKGAEVILILGPEHSSVLIDGRWSRDRVREYLAEHSRVSPQELSDAGILLEHGSQHDKGLGADGKLATVPSPEDIYIVTAGGAGAGWSAYIPSWAPKIHSRAVTRKVSIGGNMADLFCDDACAIPQRNG